MTTPASALIRASIAALPEDIRRPWFARCDAILSDDGTDIGMIVGATGEDHIQDPDDQWVPTPTAKHIVMLASPDVATALADLLDAIEAWRESQEALTGREFLRAGRVLLVARDVQAAITKGGQP